MEFNVEEERKRWTLSEEDFIKNAEEIFGELALMAQPSQQPRFILVGGQAGSGKSGLVAKRYQELEGNAIIIDQDELRTKYPQEAYKQIHDNYTEREEFLILNPYIAKLIQAIIEKAKQGRYNIVLESALQDVEAFIGNANDLKNNEYKTELAVLSVPEVEANISMLTRYCYYLEKDGECRRNTRINPNAIPNMKKNMQKLDELGIFNSIDIYIRGKEDNQLPIQIYTKNEQQQEETPIQAFERGQEISFEHTRRTFINKYENIKSILEKYNDKVQLEKIELIKQQFEDEIERD